MDENKGTIKMITETIVLIKPENIESFHAQSEEFKNYRKTNFIDTNKILSHNCDTVDNQRTNIFTFDNESLMNEYYNDAIVLENTKLAKQYNFTNNISCNKIIG